MYGVFQYNEVDLSPVGTWAETVGEGTNRLDGPQNTPCN